MSPITVFVLNIPFSMHWKGLLAMFRFHGEVLDVFIPAKRSKKIWICEIQQYDGCKKGDKLSVDLAKFNGGRQIWKKKRRGEDNAVMGSNGKMEKKDYEKLKDIGRVERGECSSKSQFRKTNVENDNVRIEKHFIAVQGHVEEEQLWKLQRCLVGETATCCDIKNLQERIVKVGLGEIRIRRIQGRFFLVDIPDDELFGILKQNDWGYLREFFVLIEPSSEVTIVEERVAWIEVAGVPLCCSNRNPDKASYFASMPMLVSIMKPEKVDGLIFLEVGSSRFPIRVVEKGLSEVEDVSRSLMGNNGGNGKKIEQGRAESVVSEFESVLGLRSDKLSCGEREELFGAVRVETKEGEKDFYGSINWARADVAVLGIEADLGLVWMGGVFSSGEVKNSGDTVAVR
ncbi:hypothetical protein GOBAR_AA30663 [Gossypium barbadense]|uniref:DUF4283 domain-containing protein n=1 Tax=Gossypium barbadense TaxID=3634 RepID=A0A2P5WG35_GOSBA|nr:hypothetical protein GOBAR_AA30663 [Gossypium barbadense]